MGSVCITLGLAADSDPYTNLQFSAWLNVDWLRHENVFVNFKNVTEEIFVPVHDRKLFADETFSYCDAFICDDDGGQQFINGCYDKARHARFEHGERG